MAGPIRIVIADDHLLFRQGLKLLLKCEPEVEVVGETDRADDLPALIAQTPCDQLLLDLQMERSALADIETLSLQVAVVVLTASEIPADAVAAIRKGARAIVFKHAAVESLMNAIRTVAGGNVWLPSNLHTHLAAQLRNPLPDELSLRETEVVRCVAAGLRNSEIAEHLSISEDTVKTHLTRIFRKLGIRDRVGLALFAGRMGIDPHK